MPQAWVACSEQWRSWQDTMMRFHGQCRQKEQNWCRNALSMGCLSDDVLWVRSKMKDQRKCAHPFLLFSASCPYTYISITPCRFQLIKLSKKCKRYTLCMASRPEWLVNPAFLFVPPVHLYLSDEIWETGPEMGCAAKMSSCNSNSRSHQATSRRTLSNLWGSFVM